MVWDDEDEYEPVVPIYRYARPPRESLRVKLSRALHTWRDLFALLFGLVALVVLQGCSSEPKVGNQGGYAVVRPYYGCPEVQQMARPYLTPVAKAGAAGSGFALFMWGVPWTWRALKRRRNRRTVLRALGKPTLFDRAWRATIGRLVDSAIKAWEDERGGPFR